MQSRRDFLKLSSAALAATAVAAMGDRAAAEALNLPLGLQLYSVRNQLSSDAAGTLAQIADLGFTEVEAAGFFDYPAGQVKGGLDQAGLSCVSSHVPFLALYEAMEPTIEFHKAIDCNRIVCPQSASKTSIAAGKAAAPSTLEDWRWSADQFNHFGEKLKAAGIAFSYHNHIHEFAAVEGVVPYDELLRLCDPATVSFELDCGWAVVAGVKPADYFSRYPHRFVMLHVKDFKLSGAHKGADTEAKVTELGKGDIDYAPILAAAAKSQSISHIFVEQEAFDLPWTDSLKIDADYIRKLKA
jgi:sugar phosphate isomerase/epimerase